jgi:thioredoxin 1
VPTWVYVLRYIALIGQPKRVALIDLLLEFDLGVVMATVDVTADSFNDAITENDIVIVDFWAPWCGPCRSFAPTFEKVSDKHTDILFAKVNTEDEQDLAAHFQIRSIPTLMIFREQVVLFAQPGMLGESQLEEVISKVRELDMAKVHADIAAQQNADAANQPQ